MSLCEEADTWWESCINFLRLASFQERAAAVSSERGARADEEEDCDSKGAGGNRAV